MILKWLIGPALLVSLPQLLAAAEPSWEGQLVVLTRIGIKLQAPVGKDIAPKTAGVAKDLTFVVKKEEKDLLLIDSRRQHG
jgi:hypothetical protein